MGAYCGRAGDTNTWLGTCYKEAGQDEFLYELQSDQDDYEPAVQLNAINASKQGDRRVLSSLINRHHADVNSCDRDDGRTLLHWASFKGHLSCVQILLESGANVHMIDYNGDTCIHLAAGANHPEVVKCLMMNGANLALKNQYGRTALHCATKEGNIEVVGILLARAHQQWTGLCDMVNSLIDSQPQLGTDIAIPAMLDMEGICNHCNHHNVGGGSGSMNLNLNNNKPQRHNCKYCPAPGSIVISAAVLEAALGQSVMWDAYGHGHLVPPPLPQTANIGATAKTTTTTTTANATQPATRYDGHLQGVTSTETILAAMASAEHATAAATTNAAMNVMKQLSARSLVNANNSTINSSNNNSNNNVNMAATAPCHGDGDLIGRPAPVCRGAHHLHHQHHHQRSESSSSSYHTA